MMQVQRVTAVLLATVLVAAPLGAGAAVYSNGTNTATFNVTLTIAANCTIAATPLNFGSTGVLGAPVNQTTNLAVTCTNTTPYNMAWMPAR